MLLFCSKWWLLIRVQSILWTQQMNPITWKMMLTVVSKTNENDSRSYIWSNSNKKPQNLFWALFCNCFSYFITARIIFTCFLYPQCPHMIISYHIISYNIISHHITSHHITSHHIISYHIISYHIISYHIIYVISYHILSYHIISCGKPFICQKFDCTVARHNIHF